MSIEHLFHGTRLGKSHENDGHYLWVFPFKIKFKNKQGMDDYLNNKGTDGIEKVNMFQKQYPNGDIVWIEIKP